MIDGNVGGRRFPVGLTFHVSLQLSKLTHDVQRAGSSQLKRPQPVDGTPLGFSIQPVSGFAGP
jgi:hypothetical protein